MSQGILTVPLGERSYDIFFGQNIYPLFQEWICRFFPGESAFVVTDRTVGSIYGGDIKRWLSGIAHTVLELPPGEENKTWKTVETIYGFLARGGADRESLVIAFGGGVVGDLAGFAAATFMRGIPCIQVPTTLLAQVDSSVGGKTGFNRPEGKNLVGAFHQPRAVFIDQTFLGTLSERDLGAGMAEVVKCALAGDLSLWETLSERVDRWRTMSLSEWESVIRKAVAFKVAVVARDERESSIRRILNLGHTVGHALEQASGYGRLLHGEAVAMGLFWETILSRRLGVLPAEAAEGILSVLGRMGFAPDDPEISLSSVAAAVGMDKKRVASEIVMPLLTAPGRCQLTPIASSGIRKELPAIRAEIAERSRGAGRIAGRGGGREVLERIDLGEAEDALRSLTRAVAERPSDLDAILLLAEGYRRAGNLVAAWETVKSALEQNPGDARAQRLARSIEASLPGGPGTGAPSPPLEDVVILEGEVFPIRPADERARLGEATPGEASEREPETKDAEFRAGESGIEAIGDRPEPGATADVSPAGPPAGPRPLTDEKAPGAGPSSGAASVRTISMADICWKQGERDTAHGIVDEILAAHPGDERALAWKREHPRGAPAGLPARPEEEAALAAFLETLAKEYDYDLQGPH